jgi:putative addiction module component (TIGR02574 family)
MEKDPARVLEAALQLPQEVRAALAALILDSLDGSMDSDAEDKWVAEIARRVQQLDAGTVKLVPWSSARRMISGK